MVKIRSLFNRNRPITKRRLMHALHQPKMQDIRQSTQSMTECQTRKQLFDMQKEYANVTCDSDVSISDIASEVSFVVTEGGYMSDVSDSLYSVLYDDSIPTCRRRRTKHELDVTRHSTAEHVSDTDDGDHPRKSVRKPKSKSSSNPHSRSTYKETTKNILYILEDEDVQKRRRSWTDSGVSLSRTDQSRCGTIKTDQSPTRSECSVTTDKTTNRFLEMLGDCDGDSSLKETDAGEMTAHENYDTDSKRSCTKLHRKFSEETNCNRLSLITDKSSLTNVTVLSTNVSSSVSSLSSFSENTSVNYATSTAEMVKPSDSDVDFHRKSISSRTTGISTDVESLRASQRKETAIVTQLVRNAQVLESSSKVTIDDICRSLAPQTSQHSNGSHIEPRKKSSSFMSGLKKVKSHLRPRFFSMKHYKDVSAEFAFEKSKTDKETTETLEELNSHVFSKLEELHTASDEDLKRLSSTASIEQLQNDKDLLDKLSSRPTKHTTFLQKLFRRSKSYSAERVIKKSKEKLVFRRLSSDRVSIQSIPDSFGKNLQVSDHRYAKSLEHLQDKQLEHSITPNSYSNFEHVFFEETDQLPRTRSLTSLTGERKPSTYVTKERANSTPNTPMTMRSPMNQTIPHMLPPIVYNVLRLNAFENECDCEECVYADYLDYLAFQRFRRAAGICRCPDCIVDQPYYHDNVCNTQNCRNINPSCSYETSDIVLFKEPSHESSEPICIPAKLHQYQRGGGGLCQMKEQSIVAPLSVTVEKERQAKTFKTSLYDTFV